MLKQDIIASIHRHEKALRGLGVRSLALFGSVVREQQKAASDIDLLYEFEEGEATLDHYLDLQAFLENLFGRRVDLVPAKYVSSLLERYIQNDLELILPPVSEAV